MHPVDAPRHTTHIHAPIQIHHHHHFHLDAHRHRYHGIAAIQYKWNEAWTLLDPRGEESSIRKNETVPGEAHLIRDAERSG